MKRQGFTLIELLVVMGVIALIAAVAVPSIIAVFSAGADAQAYNLLAAQLTAARSQAILTGQRVGVHVQMAEESVGENTCYAAQVSYNQAQDYFEGSAGTFPRKMPGQWAFGGLPGDGDYFLKPSGGFQNLYDAFLPDFMSFTIVFGPRGSLMATSSCTVKFNPADPLFVGATKLWDPTIAKATAGEEPARAVTMFDAAQFSLWRYAEERVAFLNEQGQLIAINVHTGQLFPRE